MPGDVISISGKASSPNEEVWLSSSFELSLPVSEKDGKYSRQFDDILFLKGKKDFSVTAGNVKNIRVSLTPIFWRKIEYPLSGPENATNGIATLSVSFPAELHGYKIDIYGKKNVEVYGEAADNANSVNLKVSITLKSRDDYTPLVDSNGTFSLNLTTVGVPDGEFLISAGEIEKTIYIGVTPPPTPSPSPAPSPSSTPTPTETELPTSYPSLIPGFKIVFAIVGLLAATYLLRRRKQKRK
jgi:PGF-CTERM protein